MLKSSTQMSSGLSYFDKLIDYAQIEESSNNIQECPNVHHRRGFEASTKELQPFLSQNGTRESFQPNTLNSLINQQPS